MPGRIFINYRRNDDPGFVHAVFQQLELEFGNDAVFMDVEGFLKPGDNFLRTINDQIGACDIVLVVIGPRWAELMNSRSNSAEDFVRIEIETALEKEKRIVPLLVGGATMPRSSSLPPSIRTVPHRHAIGLRPERFRADCQGLVQAIREQLRAAELERSARTEAERQSAVNKRVTEGIEEAKHIVAAESVAEKSEAEGLSAEDILRAEEIVNWNFIQNRDDTDVLRDHIARFPEGSTANLAIIRLQEIIWESIAQNPTGIELTLFLEEFPDGSYARDAAELLASLPAEVISDDEQTIAIQDDTSLPFREGDAPNFLDTKSVDVPLGSSDPGTIKNEYSDKTGRPNGQSILALIIASICVGIPPRHSFKEVLAGAFIAPLLLLISIQLNANHLIGPQEHNNVEPIAESSKGGSPIKVTDIHGLIRNENSLGTVYSRNARRLHNRQLAKLTKTDDTAMTKKASSATKTGPAISSEYPVTFRANRILERKEGRSKSTLFVVSLEGPVDYRVFTMANPPRVVIELLEPVALKLPELPAEHKSNTVKSIRSGSAGAGRIRIVVETHKPVAVSKTEVKKSGDHYEMSILFTPFSTETAAKRNNVLQGKQPSKFERKFRPTIVIDPGYGGPDPGIIANDLREKDVLLAFANLLAQKLRASGRYEVALTRNNDTAVQTEHRLSKANKLKASAFVALRAGHLFADPDVQGARVYVLPNQAARLMTEWAARNVKPAVAQPLEDNQQQAHRAELQNRSAIASILNDLERRDIVATPHQNLALAKSIVSQLANVTTLSSQPLRQHKLKILKLSSVPAVIVEIANTRNSKDAGNLKSEAWQNNIAQALAKSLDDYFASPQRIPF